MPDSVCLTGINTIRTDIEDIRKTLEAVNYHPEKLKFSERVHAIQKLESAFIQLYEFEEKVVAIGRSVKGDHHNILYLQKRFPQGNILKGKIQNADIVVTAPPLGNRMSGASRFLSCATALLLQQLEPDRKKMLIKHALIIVKQYSPLRDVTMGTLENREIHFITDRLMSFVGLDDNAYNCDCIWVWCQSSVPRTEIIVTDVLRENEYIDYIKEIVEEPDSHKRRENRNRERTRRVKNQINSIQSIISTDDRAFYFSKEPNTAQDLHLAIIEIGRKLSSLMSLLRYPFMNARDIQWSQHYSNSTKKEKEQKGRREDPYITKLEFYKKLWSTCHQLEPYGFEIETKAPHSFYYEAGDELCYEQQRLFMEMLERQNENGLDHRTPLILEVVRFVPNDDRSIPDADNINVGFCISDRSKIRVIYSHAYRNKYSMKYHSPAFIRVAPLNCFDFEAKV